jgi:hypothetical protein
MRFTDRNGNIVDVYQATTQMTDESGQSYPLNIDTLLDNAVGAPGYYGAFVVQITMTRAVIRESHPTCLLRLKQMEFRSCLRCRC